MTSGTTLENVKLYNYWRSSASYRVRIALKLKGIAYEYVPVNLLKDGGEQLAAEHAGRNPMRQVPVLEWRDGGVVRQLSQSLAIVQFLDEVVPSPALLPKDPFARAEARMLAELIQSGIQPLQNLAVLKRIKALLGEGADADWAREWILRGYGALEQACSKTAGKFLVGDSLTVADVFLAPQIYASKRFNVDLAPFPTLVRVNALLDEMPAFREAAPDNQPDAVKS